MIEQLKREISEIEFNMRKECQEEYNKTSWLYRLFVSYETHSAFLEYNINTCSHPYSKTEFGGTILTLVWDNTYLDKVVQLQHVNTIKKENTP
jgi:hypothetical protein